MNDSRCAGWDCIQIGKFLVADLLTWFAVILHLTDRLTIVLLCHKLLQA